MRAMRLALAQITPSSATWTGTATASSTASSRRAQRARISSSSPSSRSPATRLKICCCGLALSAAAERARQIAARRPGIAALVGSPLLDRDLFNACASARRRGEGDLPQAVPAELRRLRRGPLLPARPRSRAAALRRDARRPDHLRGHLAARAARDRSRARRRAPRPEHLGLAVPRRQGRRARGDARDAGARQLVLDRVRERRGRPGRAHLRRPQPRARRGRRGRRARARLRGGAAARRRRPDHRGRPPPARRAAPLARAGAPSLPEATIVDVPLGDPAAKDAFRPVVAEPLGELEQMRLAIELGLRDYAARTVSPTSSSASRAGSTRR